MFDLDKYLADLITKCRSAFGERLLYMGLQGSWLRGEAHENSDIDMMVILDRFSVGDMDIYRGILREIGFYEDPAVSSAENRKKNTGSSLPGGA